MKLHNSWLALIILFIFYSVGLVSHAIEPLLPLMITLTPYSLLFFGLGAFIPYWLRFNWKEKAFFLFAFLFTFLLEIMGVKTGLIFGDYIYGATLGLKLAEVPLIIGFNWVIIIFGTHSLTKILFSSPFIRVPVTGFLAFLFDYLMEPIAIRLDYWSWDAGYIPLQNYVAWGVIAALLAIGLEIISVEQEKKLIIGYVFLQVYFFIGLHILQV